MTVKVCVYVWESVCVCRIQVSTSPVFPPKLRSGPLLWPPRPFFPPSFLPIKAVSVSQQCGSTTHCSGNPPDRNPADTENIHLPPSSLSLSLSLTPCFLPPPLGPSHSLHLSYGGLPHFIHSSYITSVLTVGSENGNGRNQNQGSLQPPPLSPPTLSFLSHLISGPTYFARPLRALLMSQPKDITVFVSFSGKMFRPLQRNKSFILILKIDPFETMSCQLCLADERVDFF